MRKEGPDKLVATLEKKDKELQDILMMRRQ
jgi:hypothetical protein